MKFKFESAVTIESDTRYLSFLRGWLDAAVRVAGNGLFTKRASIECSLALIEAVDNAIFHAHKKRRELPIRVSVSIADECAVIEVADKGRGFLEPAGSLPDAMADHGRGLFLMKSVMSKVESKTGNGIHTMRMTYKL